MGNKNYTVKELNYSNTNTYLIIGDKGMLLFDTGWAGTFPALCRSLGEEEISLQEIRYLLISHYHPDHCGIAQTIASKGVKIIVMDVQKDSIHSADGIFTKEGRTDYVPIDDAGILLLSCRESREFLIEKLGLHGEILHTPGHSDDSISLYLDEGDLFVGDLNPLYELELHEDSQIGETWKKLLDKHPERVYYGHARTAVPGQAADQAGVEKARKSTSGNAEEYHTVKMIMKYIDKGYPLERIARKTGADKTFIENVARMYLTHQNVGVQGILDRIEIKGK